MEGSVEKTKMKRGYQKILQTCREAQRNGLKYAWVDTCCIDKTSSAELSEAINSMFRWYRNAYECYAFLDDVAPSADLQEVHRNFVKSRWFARGWTLQELLAPSTLIFHASDWSTISRRTAMAVQIAAVTGIDEDFLRNVEDGSVDLQQLLGSISVAERISWASKRETTRIEDIAYCLLGIFGVNMPLLYGEGKRAFRRLQEEIIKSSNDESIFAWATNIPLDSSASEDKREAYGIFAESPRAFVGCGDIVQCKAEDTTASPFSMTNLGVHIELLTGWIWAHRQNPSESEAEGYYALLQCRRRNIHDSLLAIPIQSAPFHSPNVWHRRANYLRQVHARYSSTLSLRSIYLTADPGHQAPRVLKIWIRSVPSGFNLGGIMVSNTCSWDPNSRSLSIKSWNAPEVSRGMVRVPFILPLKANRSLTCVGIELRVRAPSNLFHWPMPWWADCHFTSSIATDGKNAWLADSTIRLAGSGYLAMPDCRLIYATVASQTVRGARFFVVDIREVPKRLGLLSLLLPTSLPFLISDRAKQLVLSTRERIETYFCFVSYWMMDNMLSHSSSETLFAWPSVAGCLAFACSLYYYKFTSTSLPAVNVFTFHAIDITWNGIAAYWETRDVRLGKKVKKVPTIVQCGAYAALIKLSFARGLLPKMIVTASNLFIAENIFHKREGLFYVAGLYFLCLFLFPIMQSLEECGALQC
jgi:uncharacterized protein YerC